MRRTRKREDARCKILYNVDERLRCKCFAVYQRDMLPLPRQTLYTQPIYPRHPYGLQQIIRFEMQCKYHQSHRRRSVGSKQRDEGVSMSRGEIEGDPNIKCCWRWLRNCLGTIVNSTSRNGANRLAKLLTWLSRLSKISLFYIQSSIGYCTHYQKYSYCVIVFLEIEAPMISHHVGYSCVYLGPPRRLESLTRLKGPIVKGLARSMFFCSHEIFSNLSLKGSPAPWLAEKLLHVAA